MNTDIENNPCKSVKSVSKQLKIERADMMNVHKTELDVGIDWPLNPLLFPRKMRSFLAWKISLRIDCRLISEISHPDEISAKKISLGRQTHTDPHGQKRLNINS